jgi:hypothetical protein
MALVAATAAAVDMTAIDTSEPVTATAADPANQLPAVARHTPTLPHDLRHASRMEVRADTNQCFWKSCLLILPGPESAMH